MKKCLAVLLLIAGMIATNLLMPSQAASVRSSAVKSSYLSFDGTNAVCKTKVVADGQRIQAVMELWSGSTRVACWEVTQWNQLIFTRTKTVISGQTYTLKVSGTIGDTTFALPNITKTSG